MAVPSVGLLISALTFHETVNVSLGLGVALVSAGVPLTTTGPSSKSPVWATHHFLATRAAAPPD